MCVCLCVCMCVSVCVNVIEKTVIVLTREQSHFNFKTKLFAVLCGP